MSISASRRPPLGIRAVLGEIVVASGPTAGGGRSGIPPFHGRQLVTSDQLRKEREAFMERRRKQLEEARAQRTEDAEAPRTRALSRAEKLKLREDEYVPPDE